MMFSEKARHIVVQMFDDRHILEKRMASSSRTQVYKIDHDTHHCGDGISTPIRDAAPINTFSRSSAKGASFQFSVLLLSQNSCQAAIEISFQEYVTAYGLTFVRASGPLLLSPYTFGFNVETMF